MVLTSLKSDKDFDLVFKSGKRIVSRFGSLLIKFDTDSTRVGIIAGKKLGGAVIRNRIKRIARESFRKVLLKATRNAEIVYLPNDRVANAHQRDIETEIESAFIKAGILNRKN
jgi:ribonuclease P protein component